MAIASIHLADIGFGRAALLRAPRNVEGLRHASVSPAVPLASSPLNIARGRVGLAAFWDDDAALDRFLDDHPLATRLSAGWRARLEPLRAYGEWPGLPDTVSRERTTAYDGPVVVLTLGRTRMSQIIRFLRASRPAEAAALEAPGMIWGTAMARPPFLGTCSLWESSRSTATYAYGRSQPAHPDAIAENERKPFHKSQVFIRFRPYGVEGSLGGVNPLAAGSLRVAPYRRTSLTTATHS